MPLKYLNSKLTTPVTMHHILTFETYDDWDADPMRKLFKVHQFPENSNAQELSEEVRNQVRAFAFKGHSELDASLMDAFPNLGLIANYGVGYDTIDVSHATSKGIAVTNTPDVLTDDVADLAVGMLLAVSRDIVGASQWVRSGKWADSGAYPIQRTISGKSIGIVGLGRVGQAIATRLQSFNTSIHYFARSEKDAVGWTFHENLVDLARSVDIMMIAVSGGPETAGLISAEVIHALGSDGVLVNSSRGTTVDEEALLHALQHGQIRAAALDVYNNEPHIDPRFFSLENVLLQPHQSSGTIETRKRMGELQRENLTAFFSGKPLITPVNKPNSDSNGITI